MRKSCPGLSALDLVLDLHLGRRCALPQAVILFLVGSVLWPCCSVGESPGQFSNSLGMKMVRIDPGVFQMGDPQGQWDEQPVHPVTISRSFYISEREVTIEQYQRFRPEFRGQAEWVPYAAGISWHDAAAYCQWLSQKEKKPYRLPTEAEWEYVCRAGTTTPYSSGQRPPAAETANPWGIKNMHTGVLEWCLDWYGEYPAEAQVDPVGSSEGLAKVVRGGLPDDKAKTFDFPVSFYARSANRAGLAPGFSGWSFKGEGAQDLPAEEYDQFQPGLVGITYDDVTSIRPLAQQRILRLDSKQLPWLNLKDWSAFWQGSISAPVSGNIDFSASVDRGLTLTIAGERIIDVRQPGRQALGSFSMTAGKRYPLTIRYAHNGGNSYMRLCWGWSGRSMHDIPPEALASTARDDYSIREKFAAAVKSVKKSPSIGFRVVQSPYPNSRPLMTEKPFCMQGVKQQPMKSVLVERPYFLKRELLPIPPENVDKQAIVASGWSEYFGRHNHDPGFTVCPNGDLLVVLYTSTFEDEPEVAMIATRLRQGAEQWDMPTPFLDFADVNDVAPCLWTDQGKLWFFFGNLHLDGTYPFQWMTSEDNGASWSDIHYPRFEGTVGPHTPQPINSVFRDPEGTIYMASDGIGATSLLFATRDEGRTWFDTGGRSGGRHTSFVLLRNGDILGMGGKHSDLQGYMPQSNSVDKGRTWKVTPTPFPSLGTNQRPTIIRLASGRLFFASDLQRLDGFQPKGVNGRGCLVALSEDEGKTWRVKNLPQTQEHESEMRRKEMRGSTLGYAIAAQSPDGLIHLIATMTHPCLHFAMNEAWILDQKAEARVPKPMIRDVMNHEEKYANGSTFLQYSGGFDGHGRFLLHGHETWFYENGSKQYEVEYERGVKKGEETYWRASGKKAWQWQRSADGRDTWTQWWENGVKKSESVWRQGRCDGLARRWDRSGRLIGEVEFLDGVMKSQSKVGE